MPNRNRGHIVGQKPPLKPREVWSIRTRLQVSGAERDLALFNLAIDSKLRGCDLGHHHGWRHCAFRRCPRPSSDCSKKDGAAGTIRDHGADPSRRRCLDNPSRSHRKGLFVPKSRAGETAHVDQAVWKDCRQMGFEHRARPEAVWNTFHETHESFADYKKTGNIRAVQLLLGHTKLESTVRYLGIEVDDALAISEQVEL